MAAAQAEVLVYSAVWKERGVNAPEGTILSNPGTVAATHGYLIFDTSIFSDTPGPGTLIEYRDIREAGIVDKIYTINSDFRAFSADQVEGASGSRRVYGQVYAPVYIADASSTSLSFSGNSVGAGAPTRLTMDNAVVQTGAADGLTGPLILTNGGTIQRSVISGSATKMKVRASTIAGATAELTARLQRSGYDRAAVVPVITADLPATLALQDGQSQLLGVTLSADVFPTPSYRWYKDDVAVSAANGGTSANLTVTGGSAVNGPGTYRVEISTSAGTVISGDAVVSALANAFTTDLPATQPLVGANSAVLSVVLDPLPVTAPTYQWYKGAVAVAAANGGNDATLTVIGGEAATSAGVYRVEVTNSAGTLVSSNCTVSVGAAGSNFAFTTNVPRAVSVAFAGTSVLSPVVNASANPAVASRQWFKASLANPTVFTAIAAGDGGTSATYTVTGNNSAINGPGIYRMVATSTGATPQVITTVNCTVTTAP
ncbi:hypothetical protein [Luteolibacter marinus]|uniref:hypothetical protein n=1 Tax=Luteolibacter marinus TaxID=2776705 RepID=UPI001867F2B9|nr:hypothetical protein [Luteolibacter marinus]